MALTKEDIASLKEAEYIVVFWHPDGAEDVISGIRIGREVRLDARDAEQKLARIVKSGRWTRRYASEYSIDFKRTIEATLPPSISCFTEAKPEHASFVFTSLRYAEGEVRSVLEVLKVGDEIGVKFLASNNSDVTRSVNFHRDECHLRIKRGDKIMQFLLGVMVGPDNTARMVKVV